MPRSGRLYLHRLVFFDRAGAFEPVDAPEIDEDNLVPTFQGLGVGPFDDRLGDRHEARVDTVEIPGRLGARGHVDAAGDLEWTDAQIDRLSRPVQATLGIGGLPRRHDQEDLANVEGDPFGLRGRLHGPGFEPGRSRPRGEDGERTVAVELVGDVVSSEGSPSLGSISGSDLRSRNRKLIGHPRSAPNRRAQPSGPESRNVARCAYSAP